ncbi:MAG: hypothetical protein Q8O32_01730 [bacterium]|nr:hypothetical protein [bacterium]
MPFFLGWLATKLDPDDQLTKPDEYYIMRVVICFIVGIFSLLGNKYLLCQAMSNLAFMLAGLLMFDLVINIIFLKSYRLRILWL